MSGDKDIMENNSEDKDNVDQNSFAIEQFDIVKTVGTGDEMIKNLIQQLPYSGTFARVCLCLHKPSSQYFAMKILSFSEVIRLNQIEHIKIEKEILEVWEKERLI